MRRPSVAVAFCAFGLLVAAVFGARSTAVAADAPLWPQTENIEGYTVILYQPQIVAWHDQSKLTGLEAVAITAPSSTKQVFGALNFTADTRVDKGLQTVVVHNMKLASINFPSLSADQRHKLTQFLTTKERFGERALPLNTFLAAVAQARNTARVVATNTDPPIIKYSSRPAILVAFNGEPVFGPVKGVSDLQFAINTNWNMFKTGGAYYLLDGSSWLQTGSLDGLWKPVASLPAAIRQLPNDSTWTSVRAALDAKPMNEASVPTVWVTTQPAEAIVTDGAPKSTAIAGTQLAYIENTSAPVFRDKTNNQYYYLTSGRWFASATLSGPWSFATTKLPGDFAKIPASSARGWVLANVPGTPQAQSAALAADVPHTAAVSRTAATLNVTYGSTPVWRPIQGSSLQYAADSSFDVVKSGSDYYSCNNAVWFHSSAANGPWAVTDTIPDEIYSIPSTSPLYQDTYVTILSSDADSVNFSYTGGYMLNYLGDGVLYYGTGWNAAPYIGTEGAMPVYYGWPATYVGGVYYDPAVRAYARGWGVSGPYGSARVVTSAYEYGPYGGIGRASVYNPASASYYRGDSLWGASDIAANRDYGTRAYMNAYYTRPGGATPYGAWGSNVARSTSMSVNADTWHGGAGEVYAGNDGNVYRAGGGGSFQTYDNNVGAWRGASLRKSIPSPIR